MRDIAIFKHYQDFILRFQEADKTLDTSNTLKDLVHEIQSYVDLHMKNLVEDLLYDQIIRNEHGETQKKHRPIYFLTTADEILVRLSDRSFLSKLTQTIKQKLDMFLMGLNKMDENTLDMINIFNHEFLADPYSFNRVVCYYYFDKNDRNCVKMYRQIYTDQLIPKLWEVYNRSTVNKQVNIDRFLIASQSDFEKKNALSEISIRNITRLIDKLKDIITSGQKILADEDIHLINAVKVVLDTFRLADIKFNHLDQKSTIDSPLEIERKKDEDIKLMFDRILRSVTNSKEYLGFFLKEDFIKMARNKYPEVTIRRLEILLDQVTTPAPPPGIIQFSAPHEDGTVQIYFIALERIPEIFETINIRNARNLTSLSMDSRHFVLFLKKFFGQYKSADINKVAKLLKTTGDYVTYMKQVVEKL